MDPTLKEELLRRRLSTRGSPVAPPVRRPLRSPEGEGSGAKP